MKLALVVNRKDLVAWLERRGFVRDTDRTGGHLHYKRAVLSETRWQNIAVPGHGPIIIPRSTMGSILHKLKSFGFDRKVVLEQIAKGL